VAGQNPITLIGVNDTNTGPGSFNPTGITVVAVNGAGSNNFLVDPSGYTGVGFYSGAFNNVGALGTIVKGAFIYPLLYIPGSPNRYAFLGLPGQQLFQLPIASTGAQNIFDETALSWEDRLDEVRRFQRRGILAALQASGGGADLAVKAPYVVQEAPPTNTAVWLKAIGSWTRRDVTSAEPLVPGLTFDNTYNQSTYGLIGGVDFGKAEIFSPTDSFMVGLMGGYVSSFLDFGSDLFAPATSTHFRYSGGTAGISASYMNGGFFADALLKADFLKLNISGLPVGPGGFGIAGGGVNATTVGVLANVGYRFERGRYFIEPLATVSYARTKIDDLNLAPVAVTAQFGNATSFKGALGTRFGGVVTEDQRHILEANVTARIWNQFKGENTVTFLNLGPTFTLQDTFSRPFGEVAMDLDWLNKTTGWSAFTKAGAKFNKEFITTTVKGGVRYTW
jgi:outer membrane autotransporter protein